MFCILKKEDHIVLMFQNISEIGKKILFESL